MQHAWLDRYTDPAVRALAWSIGSPDLMCSSRRLRHLPPTFYEEALGDALDWLIRLDRDPAPLHAHLASIGTWKVGLHFEALLTYWLMWNPAYNLLAQDMQVQGSGRTLGALDYLLRDRDGRVHHWEVAVKFYLQREPSELWSAWVGPNVRDRLDIKLSRMRDHQLPLSARPEAKSVLASADVEGPPEQTAMVKGMFFEPWDRPGGRPEGSASDVAMGQWVRESAFSQYARAHSTSRWCVREKPDWLAPVRRSASQCFSTTMAVERLQSESLGRPQMWSRLVECGDGCWAEAQRIFVVPHIWPARRR